LRLTLLAALAVCTFSASTLRVARREMLSAFATAALRGRIPLVSAPPETMAGGTFVQVLMYTDPNCETGETGISYFQSGGCYTTGIASGGSCSMANPYPASGNMTWDGTTLTGCMDCGGYTCGSSSSFCFTAGMSSCSNSPYFGYSLVKAYTGSVTTLTGYNGTTCGGMPEGPAYVGIGQCIPQMTMGGTPSSSQQVSSSRWCNYTDTACTTEAFCFSCAIGTCCANPSIAGASLKYSGGASSLSPSLLLLLAAAAAALLVGKH